VSSLNGIRNYPGAWFGYFGPSETFSMVHRKANGSVIFCPCESPDTLFENGIASKLKNETIFPSDYLQFSNSILL